MEDTLTLLSDPVLSPLVNTWTGVYKVLNPEIQVQLAEVSGAEMPEGLNQPLTLGFISEETDRQLASPWKEVVGREVIVAVYHEDNPYAKGIARTGVALDDFRNILSTDGAANWKQFVPSGKELPVHAIISNHASIPVTLAGFAGSDRLMMQAEAVREDSDIVEAVQNDVYALGLCRLSEVIDPSTLSIISGINILPLDLDGNGSLDVKENIYADLSSFSRGVWIGKYPKSLVNQIFAVSSSPPENEDMAAFLQWIYSNGQRLLDNHGFTPLETSERVAKAKIIENHSLNALHSTQEAVLKEPLYMNIYFLALLIFLGLVLIVTLSGILVRDKGRAVVSEEMLAAPVLLNGNAIQSPQGLYYSKSHAWAFRDEEGLVHIGIDDFLQHVTGTLTNIKLPSPGDQIRKGKHVFSVVQGGKQLDISSPVSGTIKEVNPLLQDHASLMNEDPYKSGWVYKIEPARWTKEIAYLISGNRYKEWIQAEIARLKEFFAESARPETRVYAHVLQDGGELKDGLLKEFGPAVWEDFQSQFLDATS